MRALLYAALACALACVPIAHAQSRPGDAKIVGGGVSIGYDGVVPPERWSPLLVTIKPGDQPQSLRLTVTYDQDPTQRAVIDSFVTTTPGVTITVPLLVCPPQGVDRILIELTHDGRWIGRAAFARAPQDDEMNLLQSLDVGSLLIGTLGQRVPPSVIDKWNVKGTTYGSTGLDRAAIVTLRGDELGQTWAGFDGLSTVIARQSSLDRLPAQTLEALAAWVTGGGRIVIVTDSPGDTWRRFVPPGVSVGDLRPVAPPRWLGDTLADDARPADSFIARPLTVGADATARGWTGTCRLSDGTGGNGNPLIADNGSPLIAGGPFGGGMTVIVAFDPALASAELSDTAVLPVWISLVGLALPDRTPGLTTQPGEQDYGYMISSGDGATGAAALRATVDSLCEIPPVPTYVYTLIVCLSLALALTVSFGDFFILGRFKSRQRSWMTAAGWIVACGALAWVLPNIVRGSATTLGRVSVIDVLPGTSTTRPVAWRSGVTAIFSATSGDAPLVPSTPKEDLGAYWRGVSVLEISPYYRRQTQTVVTELPLVQRISALEGSSAAVVPPPGGIPLRQWTLRTLADFGPVQSAATAKLVAGGPNGAFTVTGLPAGAVFRNAALHTSQGWAILSEEAAPPSAGVAGKGSTLHLSTGTLMTASASGWSGSRPVSRGAQVLPYYDGNQSTPPADGQAYLSLDGPRRRTAAFDALAASGEYAVVHLMVNAPPDVDTPIKHRAHGIYVYRIAVPLTESQPPSLPTTGAP